MVNPVASPISPQPSPVSNSKLRTSIREFEAMLIADLLKMSNQEKLSEGAGMEEYDDMRTQAMASAMAGNGGVGIGKILLNQLDPDSQQSHIKAFSYSADGSIARDKGQKG